MEYIDWDLAERSAVGMENFDKDWNGEHICQYENLTDDPIQQSTL
jgi:hypothetical protein